MRWTPHLAALFIAVFIAISCIDAVFVFEERTTVEGPAKVVVNGIAEVYHESGLRNKLVTFLLFVCQLIVVGVIAYFVFTIAREEDRYNTYLATLFGTAVSTMLALVLYLV